MTTLNNIITLKDMEERASIVLPANALSYFKSGADEEITVRDNERAYARFLFIPRYMIDPTNINLETTFLDFKFSCPIGFAPCAMHKLAHPDGEVSTARAALANDLLMILSTLSTTPLENVAVACGGEATKMWFQLYVYKNRDLTANLIRRAEKAGFKALVLTIDAPVFGRRLGDVRNRFMLPPHLKLPNFEGLRASDLPQSDGVRGNELFSQVSEYLDGTITWEVLAWLRTITNLPIIVKGIMSPEDAELAIQHGAAAITVSNHGGRQLDTVPATIEMLPIIAKAVDGRIPIIMDGGIRRGSDVLKALALGARMVLIARPILYGLAVAGHEGISLVVDILKDELKRAMALSGMLDVQNIPKSLVMHRHQLETTL